MNSKPDRIVRHFRHILLWPLQLEIGSGRGGAGAKSPWEILEKSATEGPWQRIEDEFTADPKAFQERHYKEFVSFLPYVQRFLYGESRSARRAASDPPSESPMQVFRRHDVSRLRVSVYPDEPPLILRVAHIDLYFFRDLDLVLLNLEVHADNLPLSTVLELLHRFGRAYPSGWDADGRGVHNLRRVEMLGADDQVLAVSDSDNRDKFLSFACRHRAPAIGDHWAFLLRPLVLDHTEEEGDLRFRQIEYHRMPLMAYLAIDDPRALSREDFVRLGLIAHIRPDEHLPLHEPAVREFEARYCDDRYWTDTAEGPNVRYLCSGHATIVVGEAGSPFFCDPERGMLAQFRHQYFMLFLIAHFHRGALLVFSGRLVDAINDLDVGNADSVRRFKRRIRLVFEIFLRFTHRYWFHELSERGQVQTLFRRTAEHLGNDALFAEVKEEIHDMSHYLESDSLRRQAGTVVRLTVVTTFGLIGTITTGFLGMNLIAAADAPMVDRINFFVVVLLVSSGLTLFAVAKSKRLSDFLEAVSDERLGWGAKLALLGRVLWSREKQ